MKKIIIIVILFSIQKSFSQEYNFNLFLEYKEVTSGQIAFFLLNNKDSTFNFYGRQTKGQEFAFLNDYLKKKQHEFEFENFLKFKFIKTSDFKNNTIHYKNPFYFKSLTLSVDSLKSEVRILVYKNIKKIK